MLKYQFTAGAHNFIFPISDNSRREMKIDFDLKT